MTSSFFLRFSHSLSFSCMPLESESETESETKTETETGGSREALSWSNYRVTRCWLKWPARRAFFDDIWIWLEAEGSSSSSSSSSVHRFNLTSADGRPPHNRCTTKAPPLQPVSHWATGGTAANTIRRKRQPGILYYEQWGSISQII